MTHNAEHKPKMTALILFFPVFAHISARFYPGDKVGGRFG